MMKNKKREEEYLDFNELLDESKQDLLNYIDRRLTLIKLKFYEKIANFSSRIMYALILLVFGLVMFFMSFIALGLYFGQLLNNYAAGFGIIIIICVTCILIFIANRKRVKIIFVNLTIRTLKKIESDEE